MSNAIGKRIRELREKKSWTQATLAEASKLSERTVRRIEAGGVHPSAETVLSLAGALDIGAIELTALADQEPKPQAKSRLIIPRDGLELLNAVSGCHAFKFCPEATDDEKASDLIKVVLDFVEYGEIWDELSAAQKYDAGHELTKHLREFEAHGWAVFVERRTGTARTTDSNGKEIPLPNWIIVSLFLVSQKSFFEQTNKQHVFQTAKAGPSQ